MSVVLFFKQKTAYEMRISDWSSDVCSSYFEHAWPRHRAAATIDANPPHRCPEDATTMKVVIADDEPLARERLRLLLAEHPDLQLVAEAGDGREALHACAEHDADLVLLDIAMPGIDGLEAARHLAAFRSEEHTSEL